MAKKNSAEYWEKRIAATTWKTYNSLEEKNRDLLEFYTDASEQIKKELYLIAEKYSKDGVLSLSEMHKKNRLTDLNQKFQDIIEDLGHKTEKSAKKNMQDGFKAVYENTAVGMGDEDFSMPNKKLMEKLLNEPWRGGSFSGRLWKNQKKLAIGLNDLLLTGLQQGKTATEIAVSLHNFMGQGFNECHRLVRTETMHYLNDATLRRYKDAGVEYVQIWAAEDERTCDECSKYHGNIYPIDKCPHVPFHPNCRCTIIPVTDERSIAEYERKHGEKIPKETPADKIQKERLEDLMKISIPVDVYKASGMNKATKRKIEDAIRKLEKEYTVYIDGIEGGKMKKGNIFGSGGFIDDDGVLRFELLFNYNVDYQKVERRMEYLYNIGEMAGSTFEDYIAHEIAHILPFQDCITEEDYKNMREELRKTFVTGISGYADRTRDGAESLAEAFVRYRNGERIPNEAKELIKKYIYPWRK